MYNVRFFTIFIIFLCCTGSLSAQEIKTLREKSMVTGEEIQITYTGSAATPVKDSLGRYIKVYRRDTYGTLYGNICAEEVIKSMGFLYVIVPKNQAEGMSNFNFAMNNFGSNVKLFFRNGPFWKKKLRKKLQRCRHSTGDYIGELFDEKYLQTIPNIY